MSSEAIPISLTQFATALKDLPISTLHLKAMELRNSIAHLDYSNEQLRPFADGTEESTNGVPDPDCVDAIKENEIVIKRQMERIELLKREVESRGASWTEFQSKEELELEGSEAGGGFLNGTAAEAEGQVAVAATGGERSSAWNDGTFQTGRIVDGEVRMDRPLQTQTNSGVASTSSPGTGGGRLDDDTLRRAMEERMRAMTEGDDDDQGMHL
ncbi:hypothetical protein ONS95_004953 [Cadophora gregata]|uniref:uncharacterized protein n=1 Tax=Cadophora gregata TaxID=51156 RepID=UPI0026DB8476|nr:uncharacterized protein ONS95_004953 [Cadophora gregata]KAK0104679.1 hypothetical protein ONS95_004953 [Cadophora gregata]KAK0115238.1 hypothetical protein ONS96_013702 [Cadophora gregata f. sp. sojae]